MVAESNKESHIQNSALQHGNMGPKTENTGYIHLALIAQQNLTSLAFLIVDLIYSKVVLRRRRMGGRGRKKSM